MYVDHQNVNSLCLCNHYIVRQQLMLVQSAFLSSYNVEILSIFNQSAFMFSLKWAFF